MLFHDIVQKTAIQTVKCQTTGCPKKLLFEFEGAGAFFVATADHKKKANTGPSTLKFRKYLFWDTLKTSRIFMLLVIQ